MQSIDTSKETTESTVKLTTFSIYKALKKPNEAGETVKVLFGASASRVNDSGNIELLADSVPFHTEAFKTKAPKPGFGLLMLYGIRDSLEELYYWRSQARAMGAEFTYAEFELAIGYLEPGLTDRKILQDTKGKSRFLNLRRMRASLQSQILQRFSEYVSSEGADINEEMSRVSQIATRPDLFDRLLVEDKDLAKLDVLVIPVNDDVEGTGKMRQVAYVKPGIQVVSVVQGSDTATIVLPSWMTNKRLAKKMQETGTI